MMIRNAVVVGLAMALSSCTTTTAPPPPQANVVSLGAPTRVGAIMFNFANNTSQPFTTDQVRAAVFGDAGRFYEEVSFGQTTFAGIQRTDGDVFGWVTIPQTSANCSTDLQKWTASADSVVAARYGATISDYQLMVTHSPEQDVASGA